MIALGALLLVVGVVAYTAARLRESESRRVAAPHEVERAIEGTE